MSLWANIDTIRLNRLVTSITTLELKGVRPQAYDGRPVKGTDRDHDHNGDKTAIGICFA